MKKSSLIGHVCELLDLIRPLKHPADSMVKDFFRTRHYLGSKDRRFISETLYDILRNYRLVRFHAEDGIKRAGIIAPHVPSLLIYISYTLKIGKEEPAVILPDIQGMWRISFPKVECEVVLKAIGSSSFPIEIENASFRKLGLLYSIPDFIVEEWVGRFGEAKAVQICESMNRPAPITIRVNTLKATVEACQERLAREGIASKRTQLSPFGLVLEKRINSQALQSFKDGWFEMQDEGSQLLSMLLEPKQGSLVVDACTGGGGKTLHLAALMNNEGEIHSIDIDERRLFNIRVRLQRAGITIAELHHQKKGDSSIVALKNSADSVLIDAPCSGVGTFRRNPAAKLNVSEGYVRRVAVTQQSILAAYSDLVKPGGRLVYTTCTLLRLENEDVVEKFLSLHPEFELVSATDILRNQNVPLESDSPFLTLLPHIAGTDGFFAAVMRRKT
ncbi:MAG: methyltransferase domain-containing protein [Bacteroidetes bacterium]|nr:methyltransferase domain-containing protein [Bacteroidota bacterium]MCW5894022.1 methyltransferase domain-containing protein [Bacteroidota bacterium]